jgi:hypothetical protein
MKYIMRRILSSVVSTWIANLGGIKKKSQIRALNAAEISTGKMSKITASIDTASNSIKATTRYPMKPENAKHIRDKIKMVPRQYRYCRAILPSLNKTFIMRCISSSFVVALQ